jgi:hypothetical protein
MRGNRHDRAADEHEIQSLRKGRGIPEKKPEQLAAAFVLVDAPHIDGERLPKAVLLPEPGRVGLRRHLGADSHNHTRHVLITRDGVNHRLLFVGVVHDGPNAAKRGPEDPERDCRIPLCRWHEHRLGRYATRAVPGMIVPVAEEQHEIQVPRRADQMRDQRGACRPLALEPGELVGDGMRMLEHAVGAPPELVRVPLVSDRKAPDGDPVHLLDAGRPLIPPRHVVGGARGENLDLRVPRQPFRHIPRVQLGAAVDVGAVALDDDTELHDWCDPPPPPSGPPPPASGPPPPASCPPAGEDGVSSEPACKVSRVFPGFPPEE